LKIIHGLLALFRLGLYDPRIAALVWQIRRQKKSFLSWRRLESLVKAYRRLAPKAPLRIAEFGVGRGGSAFLLAELASRSGSFLSLYDLFGRIPPPGEHDGQHAHEHYHRVETGVLGEKYYGNIPELLKLVRGDLAHYLPELQSEFVIGRFEEILPTLADDQRRFHLVHVDCDWYESVRAVLNYLEHRLEPGAVIQIDDYGYWQGARQAIEECAWLKNGRWFPVDQALVVYLP
jgi:asparagine synthase (glutamine-hydrolysing)